MVITNYYSLRKIPLQSKSTNLRVTTRLVTTYLVTYLHTFSMQQSTSWVANRFSASQNIPCILRNPKVHYRSHKCPPPVPVLSQLHQIRTHTSHFLKIHIRAVRLHKATRNLKPSTQSFLCLESWITQCPTTHSPGKVNAATMHAMNAYRAIPSFPTSALDWRRGQRHREVAVHSREDPPTPTTRVRGGRHSCSR